MGCHLYPQPLLINVFQSYGGWESKIKRMSKERTGLYPQTEETIQLHGQLSQGPWSYHSLEQAKLCFANRKTKPIHLYRFGGPQLLNDESSFLCLSLCPWPSGQATT